jgi:[ribosomal protein S18]-alanine N-acetyltransferase
VRTRRLEPTDISAVLSIQAACPEIAQWTAWDYERVARGEMAGWVACEDSSDAPIAGFVVARRIVSDLEILNLAVRGGARRSGVGTLLLRTTLDWAKSYRAGQAILEVRASNEAAHRFYQLHGFEVVGRRPRYYNSPIEDALLLTASVA